MGVKMGMPDETVWVVAGDGGIQMNIQELATLQAAGRRGQGRDYEQWLSGHGASVAAILPLRNYSETPITGPDYTKLADAYGLTGIRVTRREDVAGAIQQAMETEGTVIIDFVIEQKRMSIPWLLPVRPSRI